MYWEDGQTLGGQVKEVGLGRVVNVHEALCCGSRSALVVGCHADLDSEIQFDLSKALVRVGVPRDGCSLGETASDWVVADVMLVDKVQSSCKSRMTWKSWVTVLLPTWILMDTVPMSCRAILLAPWQGGLDGFLFFQSSRLGSSGRFLC